MIIDRINYISKLTPRKVYNMFLVFGSYYLSRISKRANHAGMPISISIEPTTACNLRCPECPSGLRSFSRPTGKLDKNMLANLLPQLKNTCTYINFYFQGEPYLHPEFLDLIKLCDDNGIYTATSTNAHFLDDDKAKKTVESGLDRLIISIDGTDQDTYSSYRKEGKLDKVLDGTRNIVAWKRKLKSKTPHIIFQFLVVKPNEHQIDEVKEMAKELKVDQVIFKTAQIYDFENGNELIPSIDKYSRYSQTESGKWAIKNPLDDHCWRMWSGCVITWDGKLVPCCFDKDAHHSMGNVATEKFEQIWNGDDYRSFRASILRSRSEVEMCQNCSEGTSVWAD